MKLPEDTSPKVTTFFEAVRQEVAAEQARKPAANDGREARERGKSDERKRATPPPDPPKKIVINVVPWIIAGSGVAASGASAGVFAWSLAVANDKNREAATALDVYQRDPTTTNRRAFVAIRDDAAGAAGLHNCVLLPMTCACLPTGLAAAGVGTVWGVVDATNQE